MTSRGFRPSSADLAVVGVRKDPFLATTRYYNKQSQYFFKKYGKELASSRMQPRPQRTCNIVGYHHKKKLEEFQSKVFTGLEDMDRVVLLDRHPCVTPQPPAQNTKLALKGPPTPRPKKLPQAKPQLVRVVLHLKKEHINLERLDQMTDRLKVEQLPDKSVRVEAIINEREMPLFRQLFEGLAMHTTAL